MKIKMNTKFTDGDIDISFHPLGNAIHCNVFQISHIKINEDGIVEGSADLITSKSVKLRDFLKSLFELDELFQMVKNEYRLSQLERKNNKLERKLKITTKEVA